MQAIGGVVCQTRLPSSFPDRRNQFEQLDRRQQDGERGLRPFEDAAFPNAPLPPTAVAPVRFGHDGCHHSADMSWMKQGGRGPRDTYRQTLHQEYIDLSRRGKPFVHLLMHRMKVALIKELPISISFFLLRREAFDRAWARCPGCDRDQDGPGWKGGRPAHVRPFQQSFLSCGAFTEPSRARGWSWKGA